MGDKTVSVRVRFEGGDQVKAGLQEVGREGSRAIQNIGTVSAQTGAKLQNAGYQVSDFFVQVAGGTAPSRALAQQLPQLLQGFGLLGVAASVLIAALPSVWSMFSSGAGDAEALEEQLKSLTDAMKAYEAAASAADTKPSDLFAKFGADAGQAKQVLEIQRQIAAARAQNSLTQTRGALVDMFGRPEDVDVLQQKIAALRAQIAAAEADPNGAFEFNFASARVELEYLEEDLRTTLGNIGESFGVALEGNEGKVLAIAAALMEVNAATTPQEIADAMANVRSLMIEAADGGRVLNEEAMQLLQYLTDSELSALGLAQIDLASPIGAAADEAGRLLTNLQAAAQEQLRQMAIEFSPGGQAMLKYGSRTPGGSDAQNALADRNTPKEPKVRSGGGGGGGGGGGADPDIARAKALTEGVRTETEKYALALEEVNRLKQKGLITDETYNRQLDKLNDKLGETGDLGKKAASAIRSAFDGIFDDPQQALKDLAKQLAMMTLYRGLANAFPGAFGADGVVPLVNANGNVFANGSVQAFAAGGIVSSPTLFPMRNGLGLMGEAGPEAIMPLTRIGGKLGVASTGGGRSPAPVVIVNNHTPAQATATERTGPDGRKIIEVEVRETLASGKQDSVLKSRFGQKPNRILR